MKVSSVIALLASLCVTVRLQSTPHTVTLDINTVREYEMTCPPSPADDFILWYKRNTKTMEDEELPFSDHYDFPGVSKVKILNLRADDAGLYKCKGATTMQELKSFKIIIATSNTANGKRNVKPPVWTNVPRSTEVVRCGRRCKSVVLRCQARGTNVKTKAYKIFTDGTKVKLPASGVVLHRPKVSDSGSFICEAENEGGKRTHNFKLVVRIDGGLSQWSAWSDCNSECGYGEKDRTRSCTNPKPANGGRNCYGERREKERCWSRNCVPPKLTKFGYDISGRNLILNCVAKGIPLPTVEWTYNGRKLDKRYGPNTYRTVIPKEKARSGSYRCTMRNSAGYYTMYISIDTS